MIDECTLHWQRGLSYEWHGGVGGIGASGASSRCGGGWNILAVVLLGGTHEDDALWIHHHLG